MGYSKNNSTSNSRYLTRKCHVLISINPEICRSVLARLTVRISSIWEKKESFSLNYIMSEMFGSGVSNTLIFVHCYQIDSIFPGVRSIIDYK